MATIKIKKPPSASPDAPEKGWRSGKTSSDRKKLRSELDRLAGVVIRQGKKLESYAGLYNRMLQWLGRTQQAAAADKLRATLDAIGKDELRESRKQGLGVQPSPAKRRGSLD